MKNTIIIYSDEFSTTFCVVDEDLSDLGDNVSVDITDLDSTDSRLVECLWGADAEFKHTMTKKFPHAAYTPGNTAVIVVCEIS